MFRCTVQIGCRLQHRKTAGATAARGPCSPLPDGWRERSPRGNDARVELHFLCYLRLAVPRVRAPPKKCRLIFRGRALLLFVLPAVLLMRAFCAAAESLARIIDGLDLQVRRGELILDLKSPQQIRERHFQAQCSLCCATCEIGAASNKAIDAEPSRGIPLASYASQCFCNDEAKGCAVGH